MHHFSQSALDSSDALVLDPADMLENTSSLIVDLPATLDLMAAHLTTHTLNGVLLELSDAGLGLAIGDTPIGKDMAEVWSATVRADVDGPGGVYTLIAPSSLVWGMPLLQKVDPSVSRNADAVAQAVSDAMAGVAATGLVIAVRTRWDQIVIIPFSKVTTMDQQVISLTGGIAITAPVALRLS